MKRLIPSALLTFWANNPNALRADLFVITLPTGTVLYATDGQWDLTIPSGTPGWSGSTTTFYANQYGVWKRGKITSEASSGCGANTMDLSCIPQPNTTYPGLSVGIINAALNHLFDAATVWVYTAYMPIGGYGIVTAGIETKWQGTITKAPAIARNVLKFECADPMYLLNVKVPTTLFQSSCPWSFCDANCTLTASDYTVNFTALTGSTQTSLTPVTAFTQSAGYFTQGVVKCLSGANAGLSQTVKLHAAGVLVTMVPWLLPVAPGDTFSVIKGCDKTLTTCTTGKKANGTVVNNLVHFGGTPFVPVPSSSV